MRERQSLLLLRELLVMIRRWGATRPACLPVFHRGGEHTDVVAVLFKLLTKLLAMHSAEPEEALISEYRPACCFIGGVWLVVWLLIRLWG